MKAQTKIFLTLTLVAFAGLMGNILAEPVGDWMEAHFPEKWRWLAFGVLVLATAVAYVLEKDGKRADQPAKAPTPQTPATPPAPQTTAALPQREAVRFPNKTEYEAILAKFSDNRLKEAVDLMDKVPVYRRRVAQFRQQLVALADAEINSSPPPPRSVAIKSPAAF